MSDYNGIRVTNSFLVADVAVPPNVCHALRMMSIVRGIPKEEIVREHIELSMVMSGYEVSPDNIYRVTFEDDGSTHTVSNDNPDL